MGHENGKSYQEIRKGVPEKSCRSPFHHWFQRNRHSHVQDGHSDMIPSVAFQWSPLRHELVLASADRTVKVWDYSTGECCRTFKFRNHEIHAVYRSRQTVPKSGLHPITKSTFRTQKRDQYLLHLLFSRRFPNHIWHNDLIGSGDLLRHSETSAFQCSKDTPSVSFSLGGSAVAAASYWGFVNVWQTDISSLSQQSFPIITPTEFSADGQLISTSDSDENT